MSHSSHFEGFLKSEFVVRTTDPQVTFFQGAGAKTIILDCASMRTVYGMYDCFSLALNFPAYFGRNLDAFEECCFDFFLEGEFKYLLFMINFDQFLAEENMATRIAVAEILVEMAKKWNSPVNDNQPWDRSGIDMRIVID